MKKALSLLFISAMLSFGGGNLYAQDGENQAEQPATEEAMEATDSTAAESDSAAAAAEEPVTEEPAATEEVATEEVENVDKPFTQVLKEKFIEGGAFFMSFVLLALVLGLALVIERILYLTFSMSNEKKIIEPG